MGNPKKHKCLKCEEEIDDSFILQCASCKKWFHIACVFMNRPKFRALKDPKNWICDSIKCSSESKLTTEEILANMEKQFKMISDSQALLFEKYEFLLTENKNLNEEMKKVSKESLELKQKFKTSISNNFKCEINTFNQELNALKQYNLRKNIIIKGVSVENKDPKEIFRKLSNHLKSDFLESEIKTITATTKNNFSTIYVKFKSVATKQTFLKSRNGRKLTPEDIQESGMKNIILEDHLTYYNTKLLKETKNLKKYGFKYVWSSRGKVLAKHDDTSNSIIINSLEHLREVESSVCKH